MDFKFTIENKTGDDIPFAMTRNPFVIGRKEGCDLLLDSRSVSRLHCEFKLKRVGLTIKDLGSRNGTFVNGEKIPSEVRVRIYPDDRLQIGKFFIIVSHPLETNVDSEDSHIERHTSHSSTVDALPEDLLASLDELIDETLDSKTAQTAIQRAALPADNDPSTTAWTSLKNEASVVEPQATETVAVDESNEMDPAELRRLAFRERIEKAKAKDSKEAADRALKNLFGRR